jgi:hypothetical protein
MEDKSRIGDEYKEPTYREFRGIEPSTDIESNKLK